MTKKPASFMDILSQLAAIDFDLQELEKRRAVAQGAADRTEVARLDASIAQLLEARDELRKHWKQQHQV